MTMTYLKRWRGLKDLLRDVTLHGATAIERVHRVSAGRPFAILKAIPALTAPVAGVQAVHDGVVSASYGAVRAVTRALDVAAGLAIDALEEGRGSGPGDLP